MPHHARASSSLLELQGRTLNIRSTSASENMQKQNSLGQLLVEVMHVLWRVEEGRRQAAAGKRRWVNAHEHEKDRVRLLAASRQMHCRACSIAAVRLFLPLHNLPRSIRHMCRRRCRQTGPAAAEDSTAQHAEQVSCLSDSVRCEAHQQAWPVAPECWAHTASQLQSHFPLNNGASRLCRAIQALPVQPT